MSAKGYSNATFVSQELGRTFTGDEQAQAELLIEEAEAFIDRDTGRAWLVASPVANELHVLTGPVVYLENTPVATITSVTIRSAAIGAATTALVAGSGYELLDPAVGLLVIGAYPLNDVVINTTSYGDGAIVKVSYTFTSPSPVPADIRRATTMLVASWMTPRLEPSAAGGMVESISVGQGDLAIKYRASATGSAEALPAGVEAILRHHRRLVFA